MTEKKEKELPEEYVPREKTKEELRAERWDIISMILSAILVFAFYIWIGFQI